MANIYGIIKILKHTDNFDIEIKKNLNLGKFRFIKYLKRIFKIIILYLKYLLNF